MLMCVLLCTEAFALTRSVGLFSHLETWTAYTGPEQTGSAAAADNRTSQTVLSSL